MHIRGDLQVIFDALYHLGVIEPVMKSDWESYLDEMEAHRDEVNRLISGVNNCQGRRRHLVYFLERLEPRQLNFLALEVAREMANIYDMDTKSIH